jgi:hypothetical protein
MCEHLDDQASSCKHLAGGRTVCTMLLAVYASHTAHAAVANEWRQA